MLSRRLFTVGLVGTMSVGWVSSARAMQVSPMVSELAPSGPRSSYRMVVRNDGATPITVEILTFALAVDDEGSQATTDEFNDLAVFPPQSIIPPGREQLVNVRYIGDPQITRPKLYVVRAAQLPVALEGAKEATGSAAAEVMVAFNINTHVFVSPPDAKPELVVSSVQRAANGDALISVHNAGSGIARLRRARYVLTDAAGKEAAIVPSVVELGKVSALPPGQTRQLRIPVAHISSLSGDLTAVIQLN